MSMRFRLTLIAAAALAATTFSAQPAAASQKDGRLDMLFDQLQMVDDPARARVLMDRIWTLWNVPDRKEVSAILDDGIQAMRLGDYAAALDAFDQVITSDPEFAEGWNKRATLYFVMGKFEQSVSDIRRTLALEPRHFGALAGLGMIYMELENYEGAIKAYEAALAVNPHLTDVQIGLEAARKRLAAQKI